MSNAKNIADMLREKAVEVYGRGEVDDETLAVRLDVFRTAIARIFSRKDWSIEQGIRVLDALGLDVEVSVGRRG